MECVVTAGKAANGDAMLLLRHSFYYFSVLQGLMEVRSPYLEELLSLLMTVGTQNGTAGPVAMVISLLLQESEERAVKKEVDSNK